MVPLTQALDPHTKMPNCDFYATPDDQEALLAWLFAENTCHVYEAYSEFERPLRRFETPGEVLGEFNRRHPNGTKWSLVFLQLYVLGASPPFKTRRIELDPKKCGGATFRHATDGWGLVQLQLHDSDGLKLDASHTNHSSRRRAEAWAPTFPDHTDIDSWDFERITSFSSRLNRRIRNFSVAKVGSRSVLPGALKLWDSGTSLHPYIPTQHPLSSRKVPEPTPGTSASEKL
jgi:hypothetical protein